MLAWGGIGARILRAALSANTSWLPIVSPHKTVEGAVGGVLGSMAAYCVLTLVSCCPPGTTSSASRYQPRHYLVLLGMGAVASVLGILSDLFASSVQAPGRHQGLRYDFPGARRHSGPL